MSKIFEVLGKFLLPIFIGATLGSLTKALYSFIFNDFYDGCWWTLTTFFFTFLGLIAIWIVPEPKKEDV